MCVVGEERLLLLLLFNPPPKKKKKCTKQVPGFLWGREGAFPHRGHCFPLGVVVGGDSYGQLIGHRIWGSPRVGCVDAFLEPAQIIRLL